MKNLGTIEKKIEELMAKEDRRDPEFRYAILSTEIGDLGKYITHDQTINPGARPHGSEEDEALAYGQAFVQLTALARLRKVDISYAITKGLKNWKEADWRKVEAEDEEIKGRAVFPGLTQGKAYVASTKRELEKIPQGSILVTPFAKPDLVSYFDRVPAIVTDHGGLTCHLANLAREYGKTCIVGTGKATKLIKTGEKITVEAGEKIGKVYKS